MKLSIIIPIYNVEDYLSACLDSVVTADPSACELILVDDGSTDSSPEIISSYAARYPELIKAFRRENGGLGAARNTGLGHASGDYVMFLDSDDTLAPGAVSEMLESCAGGADMIIFNLRLVNTAGETVKDEPGSGRTGDFTLEEYPELLLQPPAACNKIFRRAFLEEQGFSFPGRVWYEDYRSVPKLYPAAKKITAIDRYWYLYLQRPGSIMNSASLGRNAEIMDAADELIDSYKNAGFYEKYKEELEYSAYYHVLLVASVRVNSADVKHPLQDALLSYFLERYPDYGKNRYIRQDPPKYVLLRFLITHRLRRLLHLVMGLNEKLR